MQQNLKAVIQLESDKQLKNNIPFPFFCYVYLTLMFLPKNPLFDNTAYG